MIKIFTDQNQINVKLLEGILKGNNIECFVKNEILSGAIGELPPLEAWLELWIKNEGDLVAAQELVQDFNKPGSEDSEEQFCSSCNETNPANFELCWSCGADLLTHK